MVRRTVYQMQAHSRQNSSVQDVTQAVSRTFYVMDMKQLAGFFFHDSQFFYTLWKYCSCYSFLFQIASV